MSSREAENMDPQMKLLLTCTWETFERTGWDLHSLHNSPTGVFIRRTGSGCGTWRSPHGVNEYSLPASAWPCRLTGYHTSSTWQDRR